MVKAIQVFRYEYAPSPAEVRLKLPKTKTINRPIHDFQKDFLVNKIDHLETVIKNLDENNPDGVQGEVEYQYLDKINTGNDNYAYQDRWEHYDFFVSNKFKILIIHGSKYHRGNVRNTLAEVFSGDIKFVVPIFIKTSDMLGLVNKIKLDGPQDDKKEYKNIMNEVEWSFPNMSSHNGADLEHVRMHNSLKKTICVSKFPTCSKNMKDSISFNTKMAVYQCNGVLSIASTVQTIFEMYEDASFVYAISPTPKEWNIFVTQTCKDALHLG